MSRGVEIVSQLPDIFTYFHHSCSAPHILCIQLSFNLPDIHYIYRTMSCMTGCFHTSGYDPITDNNMILILSMKMSIFSIVMSTAKVINDVIITRNDIISTLITISVTSLNCAIMTGLRLHLSLMRLSYGDVGYSYDRTNRIALNFYQKQGIVYISQHTSYIMPDLMTSLFKFGIKLADAREFST